MKKLLLISLLVSYVLGNNTKTVDDYCLTHLNSKKGKFLKEDWGVKNEIYKVSYTKFNKTYKDQPKEDLTGTYVTQTYFTYKGKEQCLYKTYETYNKTTLIKKETIQEYCGPLPYDPNTCIYY